MTDEEPDLRARLVAAGVALVDAEGARALSLREIARRAGVSHGAPRRHFPTLRALLSAVAREGFAALSEAVTCSVGDPAPAGPRGDAHGRVLAAARGYLDFARTRRGMYDLMFRHDLLEGGDGEEAGGSGGGPGLRGASLPLFGAFADLVAEAAPRDGTPARLRAGALWANLHGVAQLWAWGSLPLATGADDADILLRAAVRAHLGGTDHPQAP